MINFTDKWKDIFQESLEMFKCFQEHLLFSDSDLPIRPLTSDDINKLFLGSSHRNNGN